MVVLVTFFPIPSTEYHVPSPVQGAWNLPRDTPLRTSVKGKQQAGTAQTGFLGMASHSANTLCAAMGQALGPQGT